MTLEVLSQAHFTGLLFHSLLQNQHISHLNRIGLHKRFTQITKPEGCFLPAMLAIEDMATGILIAGQSHKHVVFAFK